MQGKILIVDAIATNRIVLKVKLKTAFFDVVQVATMEKAVEAAQAHLPDLVICSLDLTDGSAADLCRMLQHDPVTDQIPILAIGEPVSDTDRIKVLEAGVHEILHHPVDEALLLSRVRSLIRDHNAMAEWRLRDDTCRALGLAEPATSFEEQDHCAVVCTDIVQGQGYVSQLRKKLACKLTLTTPDTLMRSTVRGRPPDVFVLILPEDPSAAMSELRLISILRATASARHKGLIVLQTQYNPTVGSHALDLGADDLMVNGFNCVELCLRINAVMRRKKMGEQLRATVKNGLQAAVFDPLTGLYNRRYAMPHLIRVAEHARATGRSFAVMAADLDHFKRINDAYGHASGDAVLIEVAHRLRKALQGTDMVARVGGEEFMIVMPATSIEKARSAALEICDGIASTPIPIPGNSRPINVTISIGMAVSGFDQGAENTAEERARILLDQADRALYAAKGGGRNQVTLGRPAA